MERGKYQKRFLMRSGKIQASFSLLLGLETRSCIAWCNGSLEAEKNFKKRERKYLNADVEHADVISTAAVDRISALCIEAVRVVFDSSPSSMLTQRYILAARLDTDFGSTKVHVCTAFT